MDELHGRSQDMLSLLIKIFNNKKDLIQVVKK